MQHSRLPHPSPTPRACSNSCPLRRWCHPTISSSVVPFSSCLQSSASGSFPMSQLFTSGIQSIGASASLQYHIILASHNQRERARTSFISLKNCNSGDTGKIALFIAFHSLRPSSADRMPCKDLFGLVHASCLLTESVTCLFPGKMHWQLEQQAQVCKGSPSWLSWDRRRLEQRATETGRWPDKAILSTQYDQRQERWEKAKVWSQSRLSSTSRNSFPILGENQGLITRELASVLGLNSYFQRTVIIGSHTHEH